MSSYFITGANRGLGLALTSHLAQLPASQVSTIFAGTRASSASGDLQKLIESSNGRVVHTSVAITDRASIDAAVLNVQARLDGKGLDVLINNAGAMHWVPEGGIAKMDNLRETFDINVQAVQDTTAAFIPLLRQGSLKKVVNISTTLGSIAQSHKYMWGAAPAYKITKAALNMLTVQYALEYEKEGFIIFAISPGWLKTDLGSQSADLGVEVGAKAVVEVILNSTSKDVGAFRNIIVPGWEKTDGPNQYDGVNPPW